LTRQQLKPLIKPSLIVIKPYNLGSGSAKALQALLSQQLGRKVLRTTRNYQKARTLVINWGDSGARADRIINHGANVAWATNKVATLARLQRNGVRVPKWTTEKEIASEWLRTEGKLVCREILNGRGGAGISIAEIGQELLNCPLYTQLITKTREYRVHVFNGEVIHVQQKRKKNGWDGPTKKHVKSHQYGWIFACNEIEQPSEDTLTQAKGAVAAMGLDFGAVDIGEKDGVGYVYEVNTAPGLEGTTTVKYAEAIAKVITQR
jgi:glutathione synthase/RimK-type ligase-like ATP-grasp enzyme